jgi:hypothetical protein
VEVGMEEVEEVEIVEVEEVVVSLKEISNMSCTEI